MYLWKIGISLGKRRTTYNCTRLNTTTIHSVRPSLFRYFKKRINSVQECGQECIPFQDYWDCLYVYMFTDPYEHCSVAIILKH
jgi:hypothetical protein